MRTWMAVCVILATACSGADGDGGGDDAPECTAPAPFAAPSVADALADLDGLGFDAFVDASYEHLLRRFPETVSSLGMAADLGMTDDLLTPVSDAYEIDTDALAAGIRDRLVAFDRDALTAAERDTYDIYVWYLDDWLANTEFRHYDYPITHHLTAMHVQLMRFMTDLHPVSDVASAEGYIARLRQMGPKLDQIVARARTRADMGLAPPRSLLEWSRPQIDAWASATPRQSTLYTTFADRLDGVDALDADARADLLARAETAIACHALPGLARLRDAVDELIEDAPATLGVGALPGGDAFYDYALAHHTTTTMTADDVHALGLAEIERIHGEMREHLTALGYPADTPLPQAFGQIATDGGIVPESQIVAEYEAIIAAAEARLGDAFSTIPDAEVIVIGGPTGGFYIPGAPDGSRPGAFYARVGGPEARYGMRTLAYHEAVPGHHLQISIAQQLDVPLFRRHTRFTAYVEGWALYAERLAADLDWYEDDPYGDLGRLQAEAFRAARLVVDTGIHARGWTFEQAVDFMVDNVGYGRPGMEGQVARYAAAPGQATAYKIGMNHILALRDRAEARLGDGFDLRAFHAVVLESGALPLDLVTAAVDRYIDAAAP